MTLTERVLRQLMKRLETPGGRWCCEVCYVARAWEVIDLLKPSPEQLQAAWDEAGDNFRRFQQYAKERGLT